MSKALKIPRLPPVDANQRYKLEEAYAYLRQGRTKTYREIAAGALKVIKEGKSVYVPGSEIIRRSTIGGSAS
jgi:hypothetical protein